MGGRVLHVMLAILALLGILAPVSLRGFWESNVLMVLMAISLLGWPIRLFRSRPAYA